MLVAMVTNFVILPGNPINSDAVTKEFITMQKFCTEIILLGVAQCFLVHFFI
jgi:hypothetical protein